MDSAKNELLEAYKRKIFKALGHLKYSYQKVLLLSSNVELLSTQDLEGWESFVSRFSRVSDLYLTKYLRLLVLKEDPAFRGSLRDFLNQSEKLGLIESTDTWMRMRELRNIVSHEYLEENLPAELEEMRNSTPLLLALEEKLK